MTASNGNPSPDGLRAARKRLRNQYTHLIWGALLGGVVVMIALYALAPKAHAVFFDTMHILVAGGVIAALALFGWLSDTWIKSAIGQVFDDRITVHEAVEAEGYKGIEERQRQALAVLRDELAEYQRSLRNDIDRLTRTISIISTDSHRLEARIDALEKASKSIEQRLEELDRRKR